MDGFLDFVSIFANAGVLSFLAVFIPIVVAVIGWLMNEKSKLRWETYQLKKEVCLRALNIANAVISHHRYPRAEKMVPQEETIENVRSCMNELACICDTDEVLVILKSILYDQNTPAIIVKMRNAVRRELGLKKDIVDDDEIRAFAGYIHADRRCREYYGSSQYVVVPQINASFEFKPNASVLPDERR